MREGGGMVAPQAKAWPLQNYFPGAGAEVVGRRSLASHYTLTTGVELNQRLHNSAVVGVSG